MSEIKGHLIELPAEPNSLSAPTLLFSILAQVVYL
jgi:hypothetical protein